MPSLPSGVLVVDCLELDDPRGKHFRKHLGRHHEIGKGLIDHSLFEPKLRQVAQHVQNNSKPCVFFGCRVGKHRSVGMLYIVKRILDSLGDRVGMEFDCSDGWSAFQRDCNRGSCTFCRQEPSNFARALQIWHSL